MVKTAIKRKSAASDIKSTNTSSRARQRALTTSEGNTSARVRKTAYKTTLKGPGPNPSRRQPRRLTVAQVYQATDDALEDEGSQDSHGGGHNSSRDGQGSPVPPSGELAEEQDDLTLTDVVVIDEVRRNVDFRFQDAEATLTVAVQVHTDPDGFRSRLGYRVRMLLSRAATADKPAMRDVVVGYMQTWRINKPTATHPTIDASAWRNELLRPAVDDMDQVLRETGRCLQCLFRRRDAAVKANLVNRGHGQALRDESLLFVEMIYIKRAYQKQDLLRQALPLFHRMLSTALTEWFAFAGTVVLVPARPSGVRGEGWGDVADDEVEAALTAVYADRLYGYQVWAQRARVSGVYLTVMGRALPGGEQ